SQNNQLSKSNNQIESEQSSDKIVSTYSNNDNNATKVNVYQTKTSQEANTKNASASKTTQTSKSNSTQSVYS
ncbi:hypothetical protein, partial [Staphylococcus sp. GDX7P459A]|uniref:hypothetical protein n=1 Tax=Staphylococcus sp. GDX7P459A TaxID=2608390 RepID=UPI001CB75F94